MQAHVGTPSHPLRTALPRSGQPMAPRSQRGLLQPCPLHQQQPFQRHSSRRRQPSIQAQKGFGSGQPAKRGGKKSKGPGGGWYNVADASEFQDGKMIKSVIMPGNKQAICVYRLPDGRVYCSDANSTAFEFPLSNAKVITDDGSPKIEVPLDGTVYELETGKVVRWCPKNNPVRLVLGSLKGNAPVKNLQVYSAQEDEEGRIFVNV